MTKRGLKEIRVGIVIIAALVIIVGFVFFIGGDQTTFGGKVKYQILFDSTAGLYEGDPVLLTGVEVGNVTSVNFPEDLELKKILVEIEVRKDVTKRIRKDTRARIGSASLVYGKVVELTIGSPIEPQLEPGSLIETSGAGGYGAIIDSTNTVLSGMRRVLDKVDRGEGMLGLMLNEPMGMQETLHNLSLATERVSILLNRVEQGDGMLGAMVSDSVEFKKTLNDLKLAVDDLQGVTENLNGQESLMGRLINDKEYGRRVSDDLERAIGSIANITMKVDTSSGTLGALINDPELYIGLQDVVLGIQNSSISKWFIHNRRKAGEKERKKMTEEQS